MNDPVGGDDIHPESFEIKEYVSVGPSPEYSITMHKSTFDTGFILFTILLASVLIGLLIFMLIFSYNITKNQPIPRVVVIKNEPLTLNSNYGAVPYASYPSNKKINAPQDASSIQTYDLCTSYPNTEWKNDKCSCSPPFFGKTCSQEKHDSKYFSVGIPNEDTLDITVLKELQTSAKSFGFDSCSVNCDNNSNCSGFIYHDQNICTLLTGNVIVPSGHGISYSNSINSTLYMKNLSNLLFEGRVFIAAYKSSFPARYWLFDKSKDFIQISPGVIYKINFYPQYIKIINKYTGIYCPYQFNSEDIQHILHESHNLDCYIHEHGTNLNVPSHFKYQTIYLTYFQS